MYSSLSKKVQLNYIKYKKIKWKSRIKLKQCCVKGFKRAVCVLAVTYISVKTVYTGADSIVTSVNKKNSGSKFIQNTMI